MLTSRYSASWGHGLRYFTASSRRQHQPAASRARASLCKYPYSDVIMSAVASQIPGISIVLVNRLFRRWWEKTSKPPVTGFVMGIHRTGGFPSQRASNAENVSSWWRHHSSIIMSHSISLLFLSPYKSRLKIKATDIIYKMEMLYAKIC